MRLKAQIIISSRKKTKRGIEGSSKNDNKRNPRDLDLIYGEATRQYGLINDCLNAQADKLGIILGFVFLIIVQVSLTNDLDADPFNYKLGLYIFSLGYLLLVIAAIIGVWVFFLRSHPIGHDIKTLMIWFKHGADVNYKNKINSKIILALNEIKIESDNRAFFIKAIMVYFFLGVLLVVIPRVLNW